MTLEELDEIRDKSSQLLEEKRKISAEYGLDSQEACIAKRLYREALDEAHKAVLLWIQQLERLT